MNKVFMVVLGLMLYFAWMDAKQIMSFHIINTEQAWTLYNTYTGPAIWSTWYTVILAIGLIWYLVKKDKSEAVGIVAAGWMLLYFGTQDLFYFLFSPTTFADIGCWADGILPVRLISDALGECCPTATSFVLSGILGVIVASFLYNKLQEAKW